MNSKISFVCLCLVFSGTQAYAACDTPNTNLTEDEIRTAFKEGKTVSFQCENNCATWMTGTYPDWREIHNGIGTTGTTTSRLWEVGTGSAGLQPSKDVGYWNISSGMINYHYDGDATYSYTVRCTSGTLGSTGSIYKFFLGGGGTPKATGTID